MVVNRRYIGPQMRTRTQIFYEGPSALDPTQNVVGIGQWVGSNSSKTSEMEQVWVFPAAVIELVDGWSAGPSPTKLMLDQGLDKACCNDCAFRSRAAGGSGECYTHGRPLYMGANQLLNALALRGWPRMGIEGLRKECFELIRRDRDLRLTAYGDPLALPDEYLEVLVTVPGTRYTSAWPHLKGQRLEWATKHFMASVRSKEEQERARGMGFRCFKVVPRGTGGKAGVDYRTEMPCPASAEMGHKLNCKACGCCDGRQGHVAKDVVIENHSQLENLLRGRETQKRKNLVIELALR